MDDLAVEDVWDNSGSTRDGYVDSNELASEMFEEAWNRISMNSGSI